MEDCSNLPELIWHVAVGMQTQALRLEHLDSAHYTSLLYSMVRDSGLCTTQGADFQKHRDSPKQGLSQI